MSSVRDRPWWESGPDAHQRHAHHLCLLSGSQRGSIPESVTAVGAVLVLTLVATVHAFARVPIPPLLVFALVAVAVLVLLRCGPVRGGGRPRAAARQRARADGRLHGCRPALYRDPFEFTLTIGGLMASLTLVVGGGVLMVRGRRAAGGTLPAALSGVAVLAVVGALGFSTVARFTTPEVVAVDGDVRVTPATSPSSPPSCKRLPAR